MYKEYKFVPNNLFQCLWQGEVLIPHEAILADACADLIFKIEGDQISYFLSCAQLSTIHSYTDEFTYFYGLRLPPGGLYLLINAPMTEYANQIIDAELFPFIKRLKPYFERWHETKNVQPLYHYLLKLNEEINPSYHEVQLLNQLWSKRNINEISKLSGYTLRHFRRKIKIQTGCSPYLFYRIMRCNKAVKLKREAILSDVQIALECNYTDQSHMLNDISKLTEQSFSSWI